MIYTNLSGRCGNQLFEYAITRKLQTIYKDDITFCDKNLVAQNKKDASFCNELYAFNVVPFTIEHNKTKHVFLHGNIFQIIIYCFYLLICRIPYKNRPDFYHRQEKYQPILNFFGIYDLTHGYSELKYSKAKNKFVNGYYEDERFFKDIRSYLVKELTVKEENEKNNDLLKIIDMRESVCVSIRRGDFLNVDNKGLRSICNEEYFRNAIEKMKDCLPNSVFIFFSDEIDWVKENYNFGVESYYETGIDTVGEKLRLMSRCKHFILSNSTFSWWAQFLSENPTKIVISPDRWFNMPGYKHQLISDEWILIKCE